MDKAVSGVLTPALQKALPACFETVFQKSIIPAFEAACQTMFKEVTPPTLGFASSSLATCC